MRLPPSTVLVAACVLIGCSSTIASGEDVSTTPAPLLTAPPSTGGATTPPPVTSGASAAPGSTAPGGAPPSTDAPQAPAAPTEPTTAATTSPPTAAPTTVPPDPPPPNTAFEGLALGLDLVADVEAPTGLAWRDGDPALYVSTQGGLLYRIVDGEIAVAGDLTGETIELLPGSERGLLGLAFDPRDGRLFVDLTDLDNNTRVVSFELRDGTIVPESRREVLSIEQPGVGHNGGRLVFDDTGNLYIGSGDGGGSNGRDAQDPSKLLGAILRITPRLDGDGYDIPPDNPFADGVADRPEVWARGFRNPWGFSIDDDTGDLWLGDVGNDDREEIDVIRAGERGGNYGWYYFEGTNQRYSDVPAGMIPPVYDYPHSEGVAVMGGYVYRGSAIPALRGAYLFADLTGPVWAVGADGVTRLALDPVNTMIGWGEDRDGELYLFSIYDGVFRLVPR
jgi:glucose/arabinose dehydrogenase